MTDGILFDLDGTLWDAVDSICISWNHGMVNCGLSPRITPESIRGCMGLLLRDIADRLMPDLDPERRQAVMAECARCQAQELPRLGGRLYPDLEDTLDTLRTRCPLFVVSNCQGGYIESFFAFSGLGGYFPDYECPGRTGKTKAENIRLVCERNGLRRPVYVGDTQGDCSAARGAGVPFIHAAYGFGSVREAVPSLSWIADLPGLLTGPQAPV